MKLTKKFIKSEDFKPPNAKAEYTIKSYQKGRAWYIVKQICENATRYLNRKGKLIDSTGCDYDSWGDPKIWPGFFRTKTDAIKVLKSIGATYQDE